MTKIDQVSLDDHELVVLIEGVVYIYDRKFKKAQKLTADDVLRSAGETSSEPSIRIAGKRGSNLI